MSTKKLNRFIPILLGILFIITSVFGESILQNNSKTINLKSSESLSNQLSEGSLLLPNTFNWKLTQISASNGQDNNYFGDSVDVSGSFAIVGAKNANGGQGLAYIYRKNGNSWVEEKILVNNFNHGGSPDYFGQSVSISGDYAVIGAPGGFMPTVVYPGNTNPPSFADNGAVYIYKRVITGNSVDWILQTTLNNNVDNEGPCASQGVFPPCESIGGDNFGNSVAINGNRLIVGASHDDYIDDNGPAPQGSATYYERNGNIWASVSKYHPSPSGNFGSSVEISQDRVIVSNPPQNTAYIINPATPLTPFEHTVSPQAGTSFGTDVAIDGNIAIVGSPDTNTVYYFTKNGSIWEDHYNVPILPTINITTVGFGNRVSLNGNDLAIGTKSNGNTPARVFLYTNQSGSWNNYKRFDDNVNSLYGSDLSLDDNNFIIGQYGFSNVTGGTAYIYRAPNYLFDYDGDRKDDISVFRPSNGGWYINKSADNSFYAVAFGQTGDKVVPADFSGDGKTDVAVFRPSDNTWYVFDTANNTFYGIPFGQTGDIPVPEDFDGDGKADINVFRPSTGMWFRNNSSNGQFVAIPFGQNGDVPTVGDYDGDGKADIAVFRPSNGVWYRINSSDTSNFSTAFGQVGDKVVAADYTGDGKTDIAVFRSGTWYILRSEDLTFYGIPFGLATDVPSPGDYDGDGKADQAVYRNGQWFIQQSTSGFLSYPFGLAGDTPTPSAFVY